MFKDYAELADPLVLPINGKQYRVPPIGLADGIRLTEALDPDSDVQITDTEFRTLLLGSAYDEMLADNVPGPAVARAVITALAEFQAGRDVAEVMWETNADPKVLDAWVKSRSNRATRRAAKGAASTTPRPASTSGTKTSRGNR